MTTGDYKECHSLKRFKVGDEYPADTGFTGRIVKRDGMVVLGVKHHRAFPTREFFEVMVIQVMKADRTWPSGRLTPAGSEHTPHTSDWGTYGWSPANEDAAKLKFREVADRHIP